MTPRFSPQRTFHLLAHSFYSAINVTMLGWHHWLNSEQTSGDSDGQGSLVCCCPWDRKESDTTEWLIKNNAGKKYNLLSNWIRMCWAADPLRESQWREGRGESQGAPGTQVEGAESPRNRVLGVSLVGGRGALFHHSATSFLNFLLFEPPVDIFTFFMW